MPCISTKLPMKLEEEKEKHLKERFGQAISIIPGKSESWLMLTFQDEVDLYFKGQKLEAGAFIEVSIFGQLSAEACDTLTGEICKILEDELNIPPANVYIKYEGTVQWGWNGRNF